MLTILLGLIVLIFINALYVAAEFAAVSVRHTQIKSLADEGNYLASRLAPILDSSAKLDNYIACSQVGITISSLVLGALGQLTLAVMLGEMLESYFQISSIKAYSISSVSTLVALTISQVIFGELLPKSLALQFPIKVALLTAIPMIWSLKILGKFIGFLNGSGALCLKLLKLPPASHSHIFSPREIAQLISDSRQGGLIEEDEHKRLIEALSLSTKTASQIMIPRQEIFAIDIEKPSQEIIQALINCPFTRLPAYSGMIDNFLGIIRVKDFVAKYSIDANFNSIKELIIPATLIPESITAERILAILKNNGAKLGLVIDEHGSLKGLLSLEDVLAELFGEIRDEFKGTKNFELEIISENVFRASGKMRIDHLTAQLGIEIDSESHILSGYISEKLGKIPEGREKILIDEWQLEVENVKNYFVESVLIKKIS